MGSSLQQVGSFHFVAHGLSIVANRLSLVVVHRPLSSCGSDSRAHGFSSYGSLGMWDLSSSTGDQTCVPCNWKTDS